MKKTTIGIPRALLYYRYGVLWKKFFTNLNCKIILSPETNANIMTLANQNATYEMCLPYKIYLGHIMYLRDRCDYVLVSNICNYGKKNDVCPQLNGIIDNIKHLIFPTKIINYNLDYSNLKYEFFEYLKMGLKLNKNILKVIYSYYLAKQYQQKHDEAKENENKHKLTKYQKKVLVIAEAYNIFDKYLSKHIVERFEENDIAIIYGNYLNKSLAASFSDYLSNNLPWKYAKELMGTIYFYRHQIDGLVFISTSNCLQDSIVNTLAILKNNYLPILNIVVEENIPIKKINAKIEKYIFTIRGANNE